MTTKPRARLFDHDDDAPNPAEALKNFDPSAFQAPKPRPSNDRPDKKAMRKAGEDAGFKRTVMEKPVEAATAPAPARVRRNATGRSEQVNIKATAEFKTRFQALAARNSWTDAVTFEKAIELLEEKYK